MSPQRRAPYARQSVWVFVAILSLIVVIGFAAAGYEINHQRTEIDGLTKQVTTLKLEVIYLGAAQSKLSSQGK